jgi:hypothetical protein
MKIVLEKDVEVPVVQRARDRGILVVKQTHAGARSHPDRAFYFPHGRLVQIEFKAPGKLPTAQQYDTITKLLALGYEVYVVDSKDDGLMLIDYCLGRAASGPRHVRCENRTNNILAACGAKLRSKR